MISDIVFQGVIIGLITSIPVGPIAVLCIQRCLQRGRLHGFFSGLGAATSDSMYALLALLGLSFVIDFINRNLLVIQVIASVVVLGFGIYIFLKNPSSDLRKSKGGSSNYWQDYVSALALTMSNPMIIFLFLGVFARFNFLSSTAPWYEVIVGMGSVFGGAALWWFLLTLLASVFRQKFNIRGLWLLNKITGALISMLAIGSLVWSLTGHAVSV